MVNRKYIESTLIWLKHDLKISQVCQDNYQSLLRQVTDCSVFTPNFCTFFAEPKAGGHFEISDADPSQVIIIKKVLNALNNTKQTFARLEAISLSPDRYTASIIKDIVREGYGAIHQISASLQTLSDSDDAIQNIISPHIASLLPKLQSCLSFIDQHRPQAASQAELGANLAHAINQLPAEVPSQHQQNQMISQLLLGLPSYLDKLSQLINISALPLDADNTTSAADYQQQLQLQIDALSVDLSHIQNQGDLLSVISACQKLLAISGDVVNTAAPISEDAYHKSANLLNQARHELIPAIINKLEAIEQTMALQPGSLVTPMLQKLESYYKQLATNVDGIAKAAGIIEKGSEQLNSWYLQLARYLSGDTTPVHVRPIARVENLSVLQDESFNKARAYYQQSQLAHYQQQQQTLATAQDAASQFFNELSQYSSSLYDGSLENLPLAAKQKLADHFQNFKPIISYHDSTMAEMITKALATPEQTPQQTSDSIWWRGLAGAGNLLVNGAKTLAQVAHLRTNHIQEVLAMSKPVLSHLSQLNSDAQFNIDAITTSISHHGIKVTADVKENTATSLSPNEHLAQLLESKRHTTLLNRVKSLELSKQLAQFTANRLTPYLKEMLPETIQAELDLDNIKPPFQDCHHQPQQIAFYQRLYQALYKFEHGLKGLEQLADKEDATSTIDRGQWLIDARAALKEIKSASLTLNRAINHNSAIPSFLSKQLEDILLPARQIPLLQPYLPSRQDASTSSATIDIIEAWQQQQAIVADIKAGKTTSEQSTTAATVAATHSPMLEQPSAKEAAPPQALDQQLQSASRQLFALPQLIQSSFHPCQSEQPQSIKQCQQKADAFIEKLDSLSFDLCNPSQSIRNILEPIQQLQQLAAQTGIESKTAFLENAILIRNNIGQRLIEATDEAEQSLSLKPGALSEEALATFDEFFESLVVNLVDKKDQQQLMLLIDPTLEKQRLELNEQQLLDSQQDTSSQDLKIEISQPLIKIKQLQKNLTTSRQMIAALNSEEVEIESDLYAVADDDRLLEIDQQRDLIIAQQHQYQIDYLKSYEILQPYLVQLDKRYDKYYHLRELETDVDFEADINAILALEDQLHDFVDAKQKTAALRTTLLKERNQYLQCQLSDKEHQAQSLVTNFKHQAFERATNAAISKQLEEHNLSPTYHKYALDLIKQNLLKRSQYHYLKKSLMQTTTIEQDIYQVMLDALSQKITDVHLQSLGINEQLQNIILLNQYQQQLDDKVEEVKSLEQECTVVESFLQKAEQYKKALQHCAAKNKHFQQTEDLKRFLDEANEVASLARTYDQLNRMEQHLVSSGDRNLEEKVAVIGEMKSCLDDPRYTPEQRMKQVQDNLEENKDLLLTDADNIFVVMVKTLVIIVAAFFGIAAFVNYGSGDTSHEKHEHVKDLEQVVDDYSPAIPVMA